MKFIKRFITWLFSLFPAKHKPTIPVVTITAKERDSGSVDLGGVVPLPGYVFNPMRKYPRNEPCYCNSGLKYKKCCLNTDPLAIPLAAAEIARPLIAKMRGR